ncbi:mediator of RNA polymerase II transcription subunit 27 [Cannabis sativa]|uniref:Mediator of RNA polymerase II transcription subunit 27 n=1 Tax=Cannabis sativa TaxID=3483 RepID=A0A803QMX9_CANSA|nr:mediator of RNA polymerase II transcription subunit 27 [Cannabis sativa]XP_030484933.1 mediator of RNA polymerase II transcription subunit 27 [Cannabis sativa]XP_060958487.1 mediator of RNA polymerase II transcription subunit 27 [Cannabis sativa]
MQQPQATATGATAATQAHSTEAPPKQVALAMDRLSHAARLIADIRLGADRLLEALFVAAQPHQSNKPVHFFQNEDDSMRQHFQDLRSVGKLLEESGVLSESLRSRSNSWGLHMPLVCPDGAVVAYAWKRQLAGQAGASAVDRTRLALKAFTDQKRRFFPHLDDEGQNGQDTEPNPKKQRGPQVVPPIHQEELSDCKTLSDILTRLEKEVPNLKILTYERMDWLKRASSLPNEGPIEKLKEHNFHSSNRLKPGPLSDVDVDKVAVIELSFPSVFRAVVSLHPAGSIDPDAVAFFSPDEGGSYMHARGVSVYHVFRHITEHAAMALQYFLGVEAETALYSLLHWICSYQNLFSKVCSKCGRLLSMDRQSALLLPAIYHPYQQQFFHLKLSSTQPNSSVKDQISNLDRVYHIGCFSEDT